MAEGHVYLLWEGHYDWDVVGVYATYEDAQAAAATRRRELKAGGYKGWRVRIKKHPVIGGNNASDADPA